MADSSVGELERRFRCSGAFEDEVNWLRARFRHGLTNADGLRFASYAGNGAARAVLASFGEPAEVPGHTVRWWIHKMPGYWVEEHSHLVDVGRRVGAALARTALLALLGDLAAQRATTLMDRWVVRGDEADRVVVVQLRHEIVNRWERVGRLARLITRRRERQASHALHFALAPAQWPMLHVNAAPSEAAEILASLLGEQLVRREVSRDLVPWALSHLDPVRDRLLSVDPERVPHPEASSSRGEGD